MQIALTIWALLLLYLCCKLIGKACAFARNPRKTSALFLVPLPMPEEWENEQARIIRNAAFLICMSIVTISFSMYLHFVFPIFISGATILFSLLAMFEADPRCW